ncbi:wax ester/triacylglycerol synthase domain-containing protein [Mycobacterium marinum]|uniref:wax ester/triacylglycerol synthase domain-containing protein n=1 Tax=Mycobacterium marinum TaxID=1781 RepID=UPI0006882A93|nr:wax ester/triacylglycerol synthase domain-containing protein [Mycobacterium marinum]
MLVVTRLSRADGLSLHAQSWKAPAHTVTVVVIDASANLSHQRLQQHVATALPQLARFRSRLVTKPLNVGQPIWAEIDDFDPSSQIHSATVRAPGTRRELADLIADLSAERPDCRSRLWEAWSIDGLEGDRWALAVRMSPVLNDGVGGAASLWPRLLSAGPDADPAMRVSAEPSLGSAPSVVGLVTDVVTEVLENHLIGMRLITAAVSGVLQSVHGRLLEGRTPTRTDSQLPSISGPVPNTVLNAPLTRRRSVAFDTILLADVKAVSEAFGGSVINVVLAACTMSLRTWLQRHAKVPDHPLLMRMPFSLPAKAHSGIGKVLAAGRLRIPVHLDDPVQILANLHTATERLSAVRGKGGGRRVAAIDLELVASLIPSPAAHVGMGLYTYSGLRRRLTPICHGSVSYIPLDPALTYCAGGKVVGVHTVGPLAEGSGLNIALTSRGKQLDVSVCACPDNVPDVAEIAAGISHAVDLLVAAAQESPRGQGRSVVTEMTAHLASHTRDQTH